MSIKDRRNAVLKSSIGLNSIRDSVTSLGKGIRKSISTATEIVTQTRKSNVFKQTLIGKDNEFFRKRRENVRRRDREDELEASGVKGAAKAQGNVVSRSVKGVLGRVLNFFGIILLGWLTMSLPGILKSIQGLIRRIRGLIGVLTSFVGGITDFLVGMGQSIQSVFDSLPKFDFQQGKVEADKVSTDVQQGLALTQNDMLDGVREFNRPSSLGLNPNDPEGLIELDPDKKEDKKGDDAPPTDAGTSPPTNTKPEDVKPAGSDSLVSVGGPNTVDQSKEIEEKVNKQINSDETVTGLKSKLAQDKGETINKKNFEDEQEKDDQNVEKSIVDGINARLDELVGGKAKKEAANAKSVDENQLLEEGKQTLVKSTSGLKDLNPFKIARNLLNPFKKKNNEADSITPNTKNRSSLKRNRKRNRNTVVIVEKEANNTQTQGVSSGGSGNGLNIDGMKNKNGNVTKKMSTLKLNQ
mgnify:CR=1 FL=1